LIVLIQLILTVALAGYFAYAQLQRSTSGIVSGFTALSSIVGLILVWNPELANVLAHMAGVGRGADLLFYVFIASAAFISLYLHLRIESSTRMVTNLARAIALQNPRRPADQLADR
jgi:hypothetical protein